MQATKTIPIVSWCLGDPVANLFVDKPCAAWRKHHGADQSFDRVERETTGNPQRGISQAFPRGCPEVRTSSQAAPASLSNMQDVAQLLKVKLQPFTVHNADQLDSAFSAIKQQHAQGVMALPDSMFSAQQKRIVSLVIKSRLPSMFHTREWVEAGGLMAYSTNDPEMFRRAAVYVDKILKGAKPADLPVEQPMKFEFVINLKTATQIGLTIPPNVLARADKVIR